MIKENASCWWLRDTIGIIENTSRFIYQRQKSSRVQVITYVSLTEKLNTVFCWHGLKMKHPSRTCCQAEKRMYCALGFRHNSPITENTLRIGAVGRSAVFQRISCSLLTPGFVAGIPLLSVQL